MLRPDSERLPRIRGVAALSKAEAYATPTSAVAYGASEHPCNLYTSAQTLGRIYAPCPPPRITDAVTSTRPRAALVRRLHRPPAGCPVVTGKKMQCRPPHHLMPLRSPYQVPIRYFIDALRFARALEESQRTAIKFEEGRSWLHLQKQCVTHKLKLMPTSTQPLLTWEPGPLGSVTAADASTEARATCYGVPPLPKRSFVNSSRKPLSDECVHALRKEKAAVVVKTLLEPYKTRLSPSRHNSEPKLTVGSPPAAATMTPALDASVDENVLTTSTKPSVLDAPHGDEGAPTSFDTVRTDRMREAECFVEPSSQYATELNARGSVSPPRRSSEATRCGNVSKGMEKAKLPHLAEQEKQSPPERHRVMEVMQKNEDVTFVDTPELRALRRRQAAALVSSTFSAVFTALPQFVSNHETPAKPPVDTTALTKDDAAANVSSTVSPAEIPATDDSSVRKQRSNASRTIVCSILASTAALHRMTMSRNPMNTAHGKNKEAVAVTFPKPSLGLVKSLDHSASTLAPPLPTPAHDSDAYQQCRQLACRLVAMMTNSTHTIERANPAVKLDKAADI
ncbi:hypothetical protein GH5_08590 [Leishmania sp. Ghana 2012 LV757]|uniref:uncharacterized protein n=1 Tax=Leishmania sp. Ghana 2012 LV757 TaxID=2803181 RepID=UPI001B6F8C74|nr:hypothetical protein GH5_08590 [Leishmania sp. Ghana 2012 LV757]